MRCLNAFLALLFTFSYASALEVINPRFELDGSGSLNYETRAFSDCIGWSAWSSTSKIVPIDYYGLPHPNSDIAMMALIGDEAGHSIWQNTGIVARENTIYTLSYDLKTDGNIYRADLRFETVDSSGNYANAFDTGVYPGNTSGNTTNGWARYSAKLDTAEHTEFVGQRIAIGLEVRDWDDGVLYATNVLFDSNIKHEPWSPSPANNAVLAGELIGDNKDQINLTLSWKAAMDPDYANSGLEVNPAIKTHYVYLSTGGDESTLVYEPDADQLQDGTVTTTSWTVSPTTRLLPDTVYYWQIEEGLDDGEGGIYPPGNENNIVGPVWSFSTATSIARILTQPTNTLILAGDSSPAVLAISVESITEATYQWYYSADNLVSIDDTAVDGQTGNMLAVDNAGAEMQGFYYCCVNNTSGIKVYSDMAYITVGRLVGEYLFNGDLSDSSGSDNNGTALDFSLTEPATAEATFSNDRVEGSQAIILDGIGQCITLGTEAFPKAGTGENGYGNGMDQGTVICWVKASQAGSLAANYNDGSTTGFNLSIPTATEARLNIRGEGSDGSYQDMATILGEPTMTGFDMLSDNSWHMITARWKIGELAEVYIDGGIVSSKEASESDLFAEWQYGMILGGSPTSADREVIGSYYGGLMDSVQIYNYMLNADDIAQKFLDATGISPCVNPEFEGNIYNFDNTITSYCKIDIYDFAVLAGGWLADGLFINAEQ